MSAYADRFEALYSNFLLGYKEVMAIPQLTTKILNTVQEIEKRFFFFFFFFKKKKKKKGAL